MRATSRRIRATVLSTAMATFFACTVARADVVAIVSVKSSIVALSRNQVADLFLGKVSRYPNGETAVPIDQAEGSLMFDEFYEKIAGKSAAQVKAYWSKIIFTGRGKPPTAVANDIEVKKRIAENPNAIGYIDKALLDDSVRALF